MHVWNSVIFLGKEKVRKEYISFYRFGPGGDTSIPLVPVLNSTLATLGITTQHNPTSQKPSSGIL